MKYINGSYNGEKETIDEFETLKETRKMLKEYRLAYMGTGFSLWISQRPCKDWNN